MRETSASEIDIDAAIAQARDFARGSGLSVYQLATRAGLTSNALVRMFEPEWNPTAETLRKLQLLMRNAKADAGPKGRAGRAA